MQCPRTEPALKPPRFTSSDCGPICTLFFMNNYANEVPTNPATLDTDEYVVFASHLYSIVMDGTGARRTIFHKVIDTGMDMDSVE
jgi:hypothetical protein